MALGHIAQLLRQQGVSEFMIDAGGGNLVFTGIFIDNLKTLPKRNIPSDIWFLSGSNTVQKDLDSSNKMQHIFDPDNPKRQINNGANVLCSSTIKDINQWEELGAISDALSTAFTVTQRIKVPNNCTVYRP